VRRPLPQQCLSPCSLCSAFSFGSSFRFPGGEGGDAAAGGATGGAGGGAAFGNDAEDDE